MKKRQMCFNIKDTFLKRKARNSLVAQGVKIWHCHCLVIVTLVIAVVWVWSLA